MKILTIILLFVLVFSPKVYAQVDSTLAIWTIVSEAANQGLKGMICVGEVIRHRKSTKGFYGYRSNHVDRQPQEVWQMAAKAWALSASTNYTQGADHFENIRRFGKPWWVKSFSA